GCPRGCDRPARGSLAFDPRAGDPPSRRRSPSRIPRRAAPAGCQEPRGRWRRRSRASPAPGGFSSPAPFSLNDSERRALGQPGENVVRGGQILTAAVEPAGQVIGRPLRRFALQPFEHLEVLAFDDAPVVVVAEKLASVAAERGAEPAMTLD